METILVSEKSHFLKATLAAHNQFSVLHDEQRALFQKLKEHGFIKNPNPANTEEAPRPRNSLTCQEAEAFFDAVSAMEKTQGSLREPFDKKCAELSKKAQELSSKVVQRLGDGNVSSTFGFFTADAGGSAHESLPTSYAALPKYYEKIEKGLSNHAELLEEFKQLKPLIQDVIKAESQFIDVDHRRSLSGVKQLFLVSPCIMENAEAFVRNSMQQGFFELLSSPVRTPIACDIPAKIGEHAVELLRTCAEKIEQNNKDAPGAGELVTAAQNFSNILEKTKLCQEFGALNVKYKSLPAPLRPF